MQLQQNTTQYINIPGLYISHFAISFVIVILEDTYSKMVPRETVHRVTWQQTHRVTWQQTRASHVFWLQEEAKLSSWPWPSGPVWRTLCHPHSHRNHVQVLSSGAPLLNTCEARYSSLTSPPPFSLLRGISSVLYLLTSCLSPTYTFSTL